MGGITGSRRHADGTSPTTLRDIFHSDYPAQQTGIFIRVCANNFKNVGSPTYCINIHYYTQFLGKYIWRRHPEISKIYDTHFHNEYLIFSKIPTQSSISFLCICLLAEQVQQQQRRYGTGHLQGEHSMLVQSKIGIGVNTIQCISYHARGCESAQHQRALTQTYMVTELS